MICDLSWWRRCLCLLACATAMSMIARARAADVGRARLTWLAGAGAVAGCGIWGTHFVAMLAYAPVFPGFRARPDHPVGR